MNRKFEQIRNNIDDQLLAKTKSQIKPQTQNQIWQQLGRPVDNCIWNICVSLRFKVAQLIYEE